MHTLHDEKQRHLTLAAADFFLLCYSTMHLLLLNLTYLDVTLHKNIKHDRMYVHTFQHAPSNLEYDFRHTITHTHMNNISKLQ